jgi:hypothetical protein
MSDSGSNTRLVLGANMPIKVLLADDSDSTRDAIVRRRTPNEGGRRSEGFWRRRAFGVQLEARRISSGAIHGRRI